MPADWTYAKHGGTNYECEPGSSWRVTDAAVLHVGNLADRPPLPPAALAYCDPPWNQGNRNSFHTKAGRHHAADTFGAFLEALLDSISASRMWSIEMGQQNEPLLLDLIGARGRPAYSYPITYYKRHPARLIVAGQRVEVAGASGLDDDDTPAWSIAFFTKAGDLVVDAVTGRGLTAVMALKLGRRFEGIELSQHRASVTLTKLAALTGATPERIA